MITAVIGKTFLEKYNKETKNKYNAKSFFEEIFFELFFNHPKYLQWVTNSPFVQMKKGQKVELLNDVERKEKLDNLHDKVQNNSADASFAIGFPASEDKEFATTSGLVSDLIIATSEEEVYYSWIGGGLGIGIAGGYSLLIDDEEILWKVFLGWEEYRKLLNDPSLDKMRGNQISTWNGQWLTYVLGHKYDEDFDYNTLENEGILKIDKDKIEVNTVNWSNLFFSLSNLYENKLINTYIYSFGQMNKTIGFIPFYLKSATSLKSVFKQLFPYSEDSFESKEFQSLFGMHIKRASELGNVGLHALQPESIKKYLSTDKNLSFKKDEDYINYRTYKTWLVAMISKNKQEITDYTERIAKLVLEYRKGGKGMERVTLINKRLFDDGSKKIFIGALTDMLAGVNEEQAIELKKLKDYVHLLSNEDFSYFKTLLKFDYAFVEKEN
ncbi:hypothetical protein HX017_06875 [Myroides marinus]|uniref:hypothetical protein n=1 Tax=Myroides marinus TaxID=703342 RepID=UPI0007420E45|nr:hypothetical protein [Myroides marinus]KUF43924.1 hypothetical protein AS361_04655 [Myroides marinus]MDM1349705.1 hypothetical protein [Myroides marinus]MDM1353650.1 hypothetical protein [Myroides marinus]MDM1356914.1 hypothetical protein [Myroides marinus]MDM1361696.1 hypothetical protein [Myroides marinus]